MRATQLVDRWIEHDYPHSVQQEGSDFDDPVPWAHLSVRPSGMPAATGHHEAHGTTSMLIPEIHLYGNDNSLVIVRGYPVDWNQRGDIDLTAFARQRRKFVTGAYRQALGDWSRENYPCCHRGEYRLEAGKVVTAICTLGEESVHESPSLFPLTHGHWYPDSESSRHPDGDFLGNVIWQPSTFRLLWGGRWTEAEAPQPPTLWTPEQDAANPAHRYAAIFTTG